MDRESPCCGDLRIAFGSIRQNPFIAALIIAVIAVGIGTSVVAITLYHAKAGNPIWWRTMSVAC